jgi:hypothetical protein
MHHGIRNNEYLVLIGNLDENFTFGKEYKVIDHPLEQTSTCDSRQFSRIIILCGHSLEVLDLMNIKSLPTQYLLKQCACSGTIQQPRSRHNRESKIR